MKQKCARWGCDKDATYDKPLCYEHWQQWEAWELDECNRCHYYYDGSEYVYWDMPDTPIIEGYPLMCDECLDLSLLEDGKTRIYRAREPERKTPVAHADIERPIRYVYILKLSDATFYVGQTINLSIRLREHKDGLQS